MKKYLTLGLKWLQLALICYVFTGQLALSTELSNHYNKSLQYQTLCNALKKEKGRLEKSRTKLRQVWSDLQSQKSALEGEKRRISFTIETLIKEQESKQNEKDKFCNEKEITKNREQMVRVNIKHSQIDQKHQVAYTEYRRDQDEFQLVSEIYQKLDYFSKDAQTLYHLFLSHENLQNIYDPTYINLIDAVSKVSRPDLTLEVIKTEDKYKDFRNISAVSRLLTGQFEAWKLVKKTSPNSDFILEDFIQFQNPSQVQALTFTMDQKVIRSKDLRIIESISDQTSLEIYKKIFFNLDQVPASFWSTIKRLSSGYFKSSTHILNALELAISSDKLMFSEGYLFISEIQNQYALEAFTLILPLISEKSIQSGFFPKTRQFSSVQKMFFLLPYINHSSQVKFFKLYLEAKTKKDEQSQINLRTLCFLGIPPDILKSIRTEIHWNVLEFAIDSVSSDLNVNPGLATPHIGLNHFDSVTGYQLSALKAYKNFIKKTPYLSSLSFISNDSRLLLFRQYIENGEVLTEEDLSEITNSFDAELFTLLDQVGIRLHPDIQRTFRKIPWSIRPNVLKNIERCALMNPKLLSAQLPTLAQIQNDHQIAFLEVALDENRMFLINQGLLSVKNEFQLDFVRSLMSSQTKETISEAWKLAKTYLPYIDSDVDKYLAKAMMHHHLNPAIGFSKIEDLDSLFEKLSVLGMEDCLGNIAVELALGKFDKVAKKDGFLQISDTDIEDIENTELRSAILQHPKQQQLISLIKEKQIIQCPDPDCPGLLTENQVQDGQVCPVCQHAYCFHCRNRRHADLCQNFIEQGLKVNSRLFPGMANFNHGLSNVCYFNSAMKLLAHIASRSVPFRSFLNPIDHPLSRREKEGDLHYLKRQELQTALWKLIEQILRGDDEHKDLLARYTHKVADKFLEVMIIEKSKGFKGIKREQFDAHELLNPMLSLLDYEASPFRFETLSQIESLSPEMHSSLKETQNFLSVAVKGQSNLQKALDASWKPSQLKGENQYLYSELGEYIDALKTIKPVSAPPVLLLQLNRFVFTSDKFGRMVSEKLSHEIKIDQKIKLPVYDPQNPGKPIMMAEYELLAVVHHTGSTDGGHYTSYTLEDSGMSSGKCLFNIFGSSSKPQIYCHNDSRVGSSSSYSSGMKEINKGGYLFAYQRKL